MTHQRRSPLVGINVPRLVVGRVLDVVLCDVLLGAAPALCGGAGHHVACAQVDAQVLLYVGCARRPRAAACGKIRLF